MIDAIRLSSVRYAYPDAERFVLYDLDLAVERGTLCGIVGAADAGKSTLAKLLAGFLPGTLGGELSGDVSVVGRDVARGGLVGALTHVGLITQDPFNQLSGTAYTVRGEIAFGLENLATPRDQMADLVEQTARLLGLTDLLDRNPYELSGGQQQLVAIASILAMRPHVIVADEPTSQLDPAAAASVFAALASLRAAGHTLVVIEHRLEALRDVADTVCVLAGGHIQLAGPPGDVLASPELAQWGVGATRFTAAARLLTARGAAPGGPLPVGLADAADYFGEAT